MLVTYDIQYIMMWKIYSTRQFSLHLKSYTGEDAGSSVGERKT